MIQRKLLEGMFKAAIGRGGRLIIEEVDVMVTLRKMENAREDTEAFLESLLEKSGFELRFREAKKAIVRK